MTTKLANQQLKVRQRVRKNSRSKGKLLHSVYEAVEGVAGDGVVMLERRRKEAYFLTSLRRRRPFRHQAKRLVSLHKVQRWQIRVQNALKSLLLLLKRSQKLYSVKPAVGDLGATPGLPTSLFIMKPSLKFPHSFNLNMYKVRIYLIHPLLRYLRLNLIA